MEDYSNDYAEINNTTQIEEEDLKPTRRNSFVWKYFRSIRGLNSVFECLICSSNITLPTSNLSRHLGTLHDIFRSEEPEEYQKNRVRGRSNHSLIWKYCSKEDAKHARCHLCDKVLYFGGGNTSNITKHLKRRHLKYMQERGDMMHEVTEDNDADNDVSNQEFRKRKGSSYVWKYCEKLSRHSIRCKLCQKIMSFHGTANVITHLQRKHNIIEGNEGRSNCDVEDAEVSMEETKFATTKIQQIGIEPPRYRTKPSTSEVWKYCQRLSSDTVRCSFCKKNLSFQGTSNLQRHLHRMHGVIAQSRNNEDDEQVPSNFIWDNCTPLNEDGTQMKCNICSYAFDTKDTVEISRHLKEAHELQPEMKIIKRRNFKRKAPSETYSSDECDEAEYDDDDNWSKKDDSITSNVQILNESDIKKDIAILDYDDIIVEEEQEQNNIEEEPFDPSALPEIKVANPLSPRPLRSKSPIYVTRSTPYQNTRLERLKEDRVRMETEYYREMAGFYRMQKYLTALQAKKVRVELERLNDPNTIIHLQTTE